MESHAMSVHSVNAEGLTRLQSLISESHWLNKQQQKQSKEEKASSPTSAQQSQGRHAYSCSTHLSAADLLVPILSCLHMYAYSIPTFCASA